MAITRGNRAVFQFNEPGLPNREARSDVDPSAGWGLLGKRALTHRVSVAVAAVRRFVLTLLSALLVGCGGGGSDSVAPPQEPAPPQEQSIEFAQPGPFHLVVGDTLSNEASGGAGTGVIRYSSSDTTVATVDATTGQLTVVGAGIAMITAEKAADTQYAAASARYLVQTTQASQAITFDQPGPLNLVVGDTLSNEASGGAGTGVIRYSSSDTTIVTVDATTGQLTVVGAGIAMITAEKAADTQYAAARAGYVVSATPAPQDPGLEPQSIGFDQPGPFNLVVGDTLSNEASGGAGTGVIRYSSSDTTIVTVDATTGQLTVVGAGIAMITAEKAADAQYAAARAGYVVSATPTPQDPGLEPQSIGFGQPGPFHLMVGDTLSNVASGGAGTGVISYSSSNTTVATVDAAGQLTVVGIGTATITAEKAADANYTAASASYTVNAPSRVSVTAWVGRENAQVQVDLPLWASDMPFFRSSEADCDLSNVWNCANGQWSSVTGGQTVEDTAFTVDPTLTVNQTAYYTLQHGANQASLEVSAEERLTNANNADFSPRQEHQVVVHNNRLWVIGGSGGGLRNDVWWSVDGVNWTEVPNNGKRFSPRSSHQAVSFKDKLWVIGGSEGINDATTDDSKDDVWYSEDDGRTWEEVVVTGDELSGRSRHQVVVHKSAVSNEDELFLIGGWDGGDHNVQGQVGFKNDVWRSADGETWEKVTESVNNFPEDGLKGGFQVVSYNEQLWIITALRNDIWASQEQENGKMTWTHYRPTSVPNITTYHNLLLGLRHNNQAVVHDNKLWVIGGNNAGIFNNDVWWSDNGLHWTRVLNPNVDGLGFPPREQYGFVSYNNRLWVIGGNCNENKETCIVEPRGKNDVWRSEDGVNWRLGFHDVFEFQ